MNTQDKEIQQKREEAMKRFMAAKKRKQQRIAELEKNATPRFSHPNRARTHFR